MSPFVIFKRRDRRWTVSVIQITKNIVAVVAGAVLTSTSWAQNPPDPLTRQSFTPEQLVARVWERNPGITELTAVAEVAVHRINPAGSLDDPSLSHAFAPRTFGRAGQGLNQKVEVSQSLPWPGTLKARRLVAEHDAAAARQDIGALRLRLAARAKSAYAEWYFIGRALAIHHESYGLLEELRAVVETRYAAGDALQQDVLQVAMELAKLDRHLLQLKRIASSVQAQVNTLLNRDPATPLPVPVGVHVQRPVPGVSDLERQALQAHPDLRRLDAKIAGHDAAVTLAQRAFYPDFRVMAGYSSLWDEADKRPVVGVSINLPIDRGKRRAILNSAKATVRQVEAQRDAQRAQLLGELACSHAEVVESIGTVALFETSLLPLANAYFDAALGDYRSGTGSFSSVITAEKQKLATEEGLERSRADVIRRQAELERWSGINPLPVRMQGTGKRP
jgi:cobalt-zinc-cadmium efflux system outer membrane protein